MSLVLPNEIVVHEEKRECVEVVRVLLGVRVGEARKPAHAHAHREMLTPTKRLIARRLTPSQSMFRIWTRLVSESLFMAFYVTLYKYV